jgi:hypothetical protein
MAYRQVTPGGEMHWVNLDQIAYIKDTSDGSYIQFGVLADNRSLGLHVDQRADEILGGSLPSRDGT